MLEVGVVAAAHISQAGGCFQVLVHTWQKIGTRPRRTKVKNLLVQARLQCKKKKRGSKT